MRWFRPFGWIHAPASIAGWIATLLTLAFCVQVFWAVDRGSHSVTDTLYGVFPYVVPSLMLLNWLASKTNSRRATDGA